MFDEDAFDTTSFSVEAFDFGDLLELLFGGAWRIPSRGVVWVEDSRATFHRVAGRMSAFCVPRRGVGWRIAYRPVSARPARRATRWRK